MQTPATFERAVKKPYWVVVWDQACDLQLDTMVEARSSGQACAEAIKSFNQENRYGPKEDGGFIPIVACDRSDLLRILKQLDNFRFLS